VSVPRRNTKREVFDLALVNPIDNRKEAIRLYHARGACFNPYNDFFRRQT
jgi:hypothetical protein